MPNPGPCEECRCEPPSIVCNMVKCPVNNNGCRTIQKPNHCCPDYNCECDYNGQLYNDGERLDLPEEPCQVCYCKGGEVMCNSITCYHRDDCDPIEVPGQCCPKYENCPVRDMGSSSSDDKNILVRSANKTNHVSPKREMNPWLLTKLPSVSSSSSPRNIQEPTTEGGSIIIVSDWLSERKTTTEETSSPDYVRQSYSVVSTAGPDLSTNLDHLTTELKQESNSDKSVIVKIHDTITPVDEVIFTRIDSPKQNKNVSLESPTNISAEEAQLKLTSTQIPSTGLYSSGVTLSTSVSADEFEKYKTISNLTEIESTSEIKPLDAMYPLIPSIPPIKIQEITNNETVNVTETALQPTTLHYTGGLNESEKTQLDNDSSGNISNDEKESDKVVGHNLKSEELNSQLNQRMDTTDLQGPFFVENDKVSEIPDEITYTPPALDTNTNVPKDNGATTIIPLKVKLETNIMDTLEHSTDVDDPTNESTMTYNNTETEITTNAVYTEFTTIKPEIKDDKLNDSSSLSGPDLPVTDNVTSVNITQETKDSKVGTQMLEQVKEHFTQDVKVDSTDTPTLNSVSTMGGSDEPREVELTSDEPPVLELNSHVPFLQLGGHENTDSSFKETHDTTITNEKDKELLVTDSSLDNNNHDVLTNQTNIVEGFPSIENVTNYVTNQTNALANEKLIESNELETTTDAIFTSSHIPLKPGDLKIIAEYLINDTIKPVVNNNSDYSPHEWIKGNITSHEIMSTIMSAANISIAIIDKTDNKANRLVEKNNRKGNEQGLEKFEKDNSLVRNNVLNSLKTGNKTRFIHVKGDDYLHSPKVNPETEVPVNDEAKGGSVSDKDSVENSTIKYNLNSHESKNNLYVNRTETNTLKNENTLTPISTQHTDAHITSGSDLRFDKVNPVEGSTVQNIENHSNLKDKL
ncbi:uncharacterized protein LOC128982801 isoform X2 [Macrosteles quadrilineatus]|nr:uncharacterized protein LOC128982801 isoform X2 [Macrosteles quadrilineatus]